jgi:methylmalonyl-CoA mutase N-terminal domain/subunit
MGGSYAIEALTLDIERQAEELIKKIDQLGGALRAIETGFVQHEIADAAYKAQKSIEQKQIVVVGVNEFVEGSTPPLPLMVIDEKIEAEQIARLNRFRENRKGNFRNALAQLHAAAKADQNLLPAIVEAVRNDCTIGEIVGQLKETFGEHRDQAL